MEINFGKRHLVLLLVMLAALFVMLSAYMEMQKISRAKKLSDCRGQYTIGDYVTVDFDTALYMEYEGLSGGKQKRWAVYSTLEGNVYYVNALPEEYILIEVREPALIEKVESGQAGKLRMLGKIDSCETDVDEFLEEAHSFVSARKEIVVQQAQGRGIYRKRLKIAGLVFGFSVVLCIPGTVRKKRSASEAPEI